MQATLALLQLHILSRLRLDYEPYAAEDEHYSHGLLPRKEAHAAGDAHRYRHHGLHIVVDAHHGRAQRALRCLHAKVGYVGAEEHHETRFEPCLEADSLPVGRRGVRAEKRREQEGSPREHPLAHSYRTVTFQYVAVEREVERERHLRSHAQQVAAYVADARVVGNGSAGNQNDGARAAYAHAQRLAPRDRFLQNERCEYHCEDRQRRGYDGGVRRSGDAQTDGEATLVADESEHAGSAEHEDVLERHMLVLCEERCYPEEHRSSQGAQVYHIQIVHPVQHRVLADRSHEAPNDAGGENGEVGNQYAFVLHCVYTR